MISGRFGFQLFLWRPLRFTASQAIIWNWVLGITSYLDRTLAINSETFEFEDKVVFGAFIPVRIGYRYQKPEGGFFFRVGYTPLINIPIREGKTWNFEPRFAGLSFGKSF